MVFSLPRARTCVTCGLTKKTLPGGAELWYPCHLGLGLSDVSGYFCVQLMSFKLTTTRQVRNSALEVGLSYDSDLSRLPVGRRIIVDKEVEKTS